MNDFVDSPESRSLPDRRGTRPESIDAHQERRTLGFRRATDRVDGIEVGQAELGTATAQVLYRLSCTCGRSWFELREKRMATCPACKKVCLVTVQRATGD
ncbi:MAG: hypothetical protein U1F11_11580 [Steroidobacteraceae bacterium]